MENHLKTRYLFLHFGPGGNAAFERLRLERFNQVVEFWDQPVLAASECAFENLVSQIAEKYDSGNYEGVIAHSFGCDLAMHLEGRTKRPIKELILLSPIRDLALGFANLANHLGKKAEASALKKVISERKGIRSSPEEIEKFWGAIQVMITDPNFYRSYWNSDRNYKMHVEAMPLLPPLEVSMWQTGINDFLVNKEAAPDSKALKKKVYLGDKDPYYTDVNIEKLEWEKRGFTAIVAKDCGHYTHIESNALEDLN